MIAALAASVGQHNASVVAAMTAPLASQLVAMAAAFAASFYQQNAQVVAAMAAPLASPLAAMATALAAALATALVAHTSTGARRMDCG